VLTVTVTHAHGSYEVHVAPGVSTELATRVAALHPGARIAIISDPTIRAALTKEGRWPAINGLVIEVPPGEQAKSREEWARVTDLLLAAGLGRDSVLVALGGGSIGDLTGFVAATYLRGVPCIQVPTTLLAMVDASVGGKTGVDTAAGKNLVGAFHPPSLVLCDPALLTTLPEPIYREGFAEGVKHGLVADAEYFHWILTNAELLKVRDAPTVAEFVRRSVEIKAAIVSRDEREEGERAILNAGHTVGHALELLHRYEMRHGDAVATGLLLEARIAESLGIAPAGLADQITMTFAQLEYRIDPGIDLGHRELWDAMRTDKKNRAGRVRMALPARIGTPARDGAAWTIAVGPEDLDVQQPVRR
jgi:3-dehydroquinate synthase